MEQTIEEHYGKLVLANIFTSIWLGDWERYEEIFSEMTEELQKNFPFHSYYNREEVTLWYDNHFFIPGDYFVPPYFSSYQIKKNADEEAKKKDILCLIGMYEEMGFYFPLEKDLYPDHIGFLTAFLSSILQEEMKAIDSGSRADVSKLHEYEDKMVSEYIFPLLTPLVSYADEKMQHPFFKEFLPYYVHAIKENWK